MEPPVVARPDFAPPIAKAVSPAREPRPLISDFLRRPEWLWLTHVVPITLLLAWAGHTYFLVESDMSAWQRADSVALAIALLAAAGCAAGMAVFGARRGVLLSNARCGSLLVMSLAVIGASILFAWYAIPTGESAWMVNRWELLSEACSLAMPGAYYAILLLSSGPLRRHGGVEFARLVLGTALGAVVFYGLIRGAVWLGDHSAWDRNASWLISIFMVTLFIGGGAVVTALITRSTLIAYTGLRRQHPWWQQGFLFVVAILGPLGGLYLNKTIPFPVDLQAPIIYLLALLNGGLLLLPNVRSIFWHRVIWLAQCLLFPFSAYFFIVFLPWLPASLFAMIAVGAGFLMLVPLVLGICHTSRIADGFREEVRDGSVWPAAVMGLCAILTLPALGLWSTWRDREALDEALTYIYSPDYRKDATFPGSLPALASSLQHLRDAKKGIFLPFLTPLYNEIVFHGLVLPDAKIDELQAAFFGTAPAPQASVLLRSRSLDDDFGEDGPIPPDRDVVLDDIKVSEERSGTANTAQLLLTMRNCGSGASEFSANVHLPDGVYVTGFALKMGGAFVPARITEKKTALWVYEKITELHGGLDPGILTFDSRTDLTLRVAPFASGEVRQARLDIVYADNAVVPVTFDTKFVPGALPKIVLLDAASPAHGSPAAATCVTEAGSVVVANLANAANAPVRRTPYLDVLIDCSRNAVYSAASLTRAIDQASRAFPDAKMARVTAINFEARDVVPKLVPVDQLDAARICRDLLPSRGGFLQDRFLKRGLLLADDLMQIGPEQALLRPQFVLISSLGQQGRREDRLDDFLRFAPDARVIYTEDGSGALTGEDLVSRKPATFADEPAVTLWRWDDRYAVSADTPRLVLNFPGERKPGGLTIYDAKQHTFLPVTTGPAVPSESRFADGVRTWAAQDEAEFDPRLLKDGAAALLSLSKRTGVLVPDASYIAVESMAQWRAMEEKEKQKLRNNQVYEFEEPVAAPEPSTWTLLGVGLLALALRHRLRQT